MANRVDTDTNPADARHASGVATKPPGAPRANGATEAPSAPPANPAAPGARPAYGPPGAAPGADAASAPAARRGLPSLVVIILVLALLGAGGYFGYNYLQDQQAYVSTDNAVVSGSLLQVGSLNAGQVSSVSVDIGDVVTRDQPLATITLPTALGSAPGGTAKLGFRGTDDQQVAVHSPIDGVVVQRQGNPGDTVAAGQPLITVVDPTKFWVQAQIEETKVARVRPGQPVEVTVDVVGQRFTGRVIAVGRASSATFSLLPQGNTSGNYTKVTQLVPVKIALDYGALPLTLGTSVEIKIRVRE